MSIGIIGNDKNNKLLDYNKENKYYDPYVDINLETSNNSHAILCKEVKQNSFVLDVGCGQGIIGKILKRELNCRVYGIELDKTAINVANKEKCYKKIYNFDVANRIGNEFELFVADNLKFDYIIFSDVLEHLINPADALLFFFKSLNEKGKILISLPNISHFDIINGLLNDEFNYSDMGILDNTHLRFFTKYSFAEYIDSINKKYELSIDCKLIGQTIIKPHFYSKYPMIDSLFSLNPQLLVLQNLFMLSPNSSDTSSLRSLLSENKIDLISKLEENIKNNYLLINKNNSLIKENNELKNDIENIKQISNSYESRLNVILNSNSWKVTSPLRKITDTLKKIKIELKYSSDKKPSIMFFVHIWRRLDDPDNTEIGGTTLYVLDIIYNINKKFHCYVLTVIKNKYVLVTFENHKEIIYDLGLNVKVKNFDRYDKDFYINIKRLLINLNIDLLHINHIIDFPSDLQLLSKEFHTITTLHDYTFICPRYFLINEKNKLCNYYLNCHKCVKGLTEMQYKIRHDACQKLLLNSDWVIAPDDSMINEFSKVYKLSNIRIIPHGINFKEYIKFDKYDRNNKKSNQSIFNIAFVGSVDNHKGGEIVKNLIFHTKDDSIKYHVFGITSTNELKQNKSNYEFHDRYKRKDIPWLLNKFKIDLVLFLNPCKESFSYTLSEVLYAGIPCLSFDIGAIGNRIKTNQVGWVIPPTDNYEIILKMIFHIKEDQIYQEVKNNVINYNVPELSSSLDEMKDIYYMYKNDNTKDISTQILFLRQFNKVSMRRECEI